MKTRNVIAAGALTMALIFSGNAEARNSRNDNPRNNNRSSVNHNNHRNDDRYNNNRHNHRPAVQVRYDRHHHGNCCAGYVSYLPVGARRVMLNGSIYFNLGNVWFEVHGGNGYRVIDCPVAWHF